MKYSKIRKVTMYQVLDTFEYIFCIAKGKDCFYAIIAHGDELETEKTMSVAIAKQILLNRLYQIIYKEAHENKDNSELMEEVKQYKTSQIVNFIY